MSFYLLSHVMFQKNIPIYGPVQVLQRFLEEKKQSVQLAYLPLFLEGQYIQTGLHEEKIEKHFSNMLLKYLYDIGYCFRFLWTRHPQKNDVVIAVDPLNCISAVVLKFFYQFHLIYYTADFSDKRFDQSLLNKIYHFLDQTCLTHCDANWCVSERIVEKRKQQQPQAKVYFVPNTPILGKDKPSKQSSSLKNKLLYVGRMDDHMQVRLLLDLIRDLTNKKQQISLTLIGGGPLDEMIQSYIKEHKLGQNIQFLGPQKNQVVISTIKKCGIGLALYTGGNLWNLYGDSMKIREYQYFGLPVITTEVPSNAIEVESFNCGVVIPSKKVNLSTLKKALKKIQFEYISYTQKAYEVTLLRKKDAILATLLSDYL